MMVNRKTCTLIFCVLQLAFINPIFAIPIQEAGQQQIHQDPIQNTDDIQSDSVNGCGLHGLITDSQSDEQTEQTQEPSTTDSNTESQDNTDSTVEPQNNATQHICSFVHDPCEKCECAGCYEACEYCPRKWHCSVCHKEKEEKVIGPTEVITIIGGAAAYMSTQRYGPAILDYVFDTFPKAPSILTNAMATVTGRLGVLTAGLVNIVPPTPLIVPNAISTISTAVFRTSEKVILTFDKIPLTLKLAAFTIAFAAALYFEDKAPICTRKRKDRKKTL